MTIALLGSTGLVGSALLNQISFSGHYELANPGAMAGTFHDMVICAGAPKWENRYFDSIRTDRFLLISTLDVYGPAHGVDESSLPDPSTQVARFEQAAVEQFGSKCTIVRLPDVFGPGLGCVSELILDAHPESEFQFYNLSRLWHDLRVILRAPNCRLVNFATAPVKASAAAEAIGEFPLDGRTKRSSDKRTRHAGLFGVSGHYMRTREQVLHGVAVHSRSATARASREVIIVG